MPTGVGKAVFKKSEIFFLKAQDCYRRVSGNKAALKWFSDQEALSASEERDALLKRLNDCVQWDANGVKPHIGPLSPGCQICRDGGWGCNLINTVCTRDCFFCKRPHAPIFEQDSRTDEYRFKTPSEHAEFVKALRIKGVGFSGGEPLLVVDRLLAYIEELRNVFGDSIYLWVYTNGDLVTSEIMQMLSGAGLDEIRFNISAQDYALSSLALARKFIKTVTVEIPVIPEDFERVKTLLETLPSCGVAFVNLHQLTVESQNWRALNRRAYRIDCSVNQSVYESELCALRLLDHACERGISLPINYCPSVYKDRYQNRGRRIQRARARLEGFQEVTAAGFIRLLEVYGSQEEALNLRHRLVAANCASGMWKASRRGDSIMLHSSLMPYVDWSSLKLTIRYFDPGIRPGQRIKRFNIKHLRPTRREIKKRSGLGKPAFDLWQRHFTKQLVATAANAVPDLLEDLAPYEQFKYGFPQVC